MSAPWMRRRAVLGATLLAGMGRAGPSRARGLKPLRLTLAWYAQAPVGGFYQALARGLYRDAGLDVTISNGGPQVNAVQLLMAGQCDLITGYDFQTLHGVAAGMPLVTVGASFQHDLQGMILHEPARSLADLKGRRVLIASSSRQTFWPWLSRRYALSAAQAAPYTFNLQPFLVSPDVAVQGYACSEMFDIRQAGVAARFFAFSDEGYPPYGTTIVTTRALAGGDPASVTGFVRASMMGWREYLHGDPAPGNALIRRASAREDAARLAYGIATMRAASVLTGRQDGLRALGSMTEARWRATYEFMVGNGLIAPGVDWRAAFETRFADAAQVVPA